jgi:uncharacterized protein
MTRRQNGARFCPVRFETGRLSPASTFALCLILIFCLCSCTALWTQKGQYAGVEPLLARGDFSVAARQVERNRSLYGSSKDEVLYLLDLGLLQHYGGQYEASVRTLEKAEQAIENAYTRSLSRAGLSMALNDNVLVYAGADYENVYLSLFNALNFIALEDTERAFVEIRRIDEKLKVLEDRHWKVAQRYNEAREHDERFAPGKNRFLNSALGRWLSLLLYRAEGRLDEARIDLEKIAAARDLQPALYPFAPPDLSGALQPPEPGRLRLSFLSLTGQAPEKQADTFWIHTQQDRIFIAAQDGRREFDWNFYGPHTLFWPGVEPGYTFKFQMPRMELRGTRVAGVRVRINGEASLELEKIESFENAARETFRVEAPLIYLRTLTRAVSKGIAAAQLQQAAEERWGELQGLVAGLLAGAGVGISEHADLRLTRFFPAGALIGEIDLPPGEHRIDIDYLGRSGAVLYTDAIGTVQLRSDGVNLIESVYLK